MLSQRSKLALVYNGELYNLSDIRNRLTGDEAAGLNGHGDTVLLMAMLEKYGYEALDYLAGMYAFATWDYNEKRLSICRDRMGIKPLYYHYDQTMKVFSFCSEIKGLLQFPWINPELENKALLQYMHLRYNDAEVSMFKGIKKLMPAHVIHIAENSFKYKRYWRLELPNTYDRTKDYSEELQDRLELSVKEHLVSDVPVGVFLSGGVDSNAIMSIAAQNSEVVPQSFSVGFSTEKGRDEIQNINKSVSFFGSEHNELILSPDIESVLPEVIWGADEPLADPACVPTYLLSKMASEKVKLVLSGEGADELFGGYERSQLMLYLHKYLRHVPTPLLQFGVNTLERVPAFLLDKVFKYTSKLGPKGFERLKDFVTHAHQPSRAYSAANAVCDSSELVQLFNDDVIKEYDFETHFMLHDSKYFSDATGDGFLNSELRYEIETRLWADLLMKLDNSSMPFALEGRVPFLDHRLVEFSAQIPPEQKIRGLHNKVVLRKAAKKWLPKEIYSRKKDHFFVPIDKWLQNELKPMVQEYLNDSFIQQQQLFNPEYIRSIYAKYSEGDLVYARILWCLLIFQIWYVRYIETGSYRSKTVEDTFAPLVSSFD